MSGWSVSGKSRTTLGGDFLNLAATTGQKTFNFAPKQTVTSNIPWIVGGLVTVAALYVYSKGG